jgi:tetratricopeptide (TPR) repeat protein
MSGVYIHKGDLDRAIEYGELAAQKAPTPFEQAGAQIILAWSWCRAGDPDRGIEVLASVVPIMRASGIVPFEIFFLPCLADGYLLAGKYDEARETAKDLLEISEHSGARFFLSVAHYYLGEISLKTNTDQAAPHFENAISICRELRAENNLALAYSGMGRYHKQQCNTEQAREYLTKALDIFERLGNLLEPDKVRNELAQLP